MTRWKLKRTMQCEKCPWRKDVDPREIPHGYCETRHRKLDATIAQPGEVFHDRPAMACHETEDAYCIGWLINQVGIGNNIPLRIKMMACENAKAIRLRGDQHERFEDTLP